MLKTINQTLAEEIFGIWKDNERIPGELRFEGFGEGAMFKIIDEKDIYLCLSYGGTFQINMLVTSIQYDGDTITFNDWMASKVKMKVVE